MRQSYPLTVGKERFVIYTLTGHVLGHQESTESEVHGGGGGGVGAYGAYSQSAIKISTTHKCQTRFFVRSQDGEEIAVSFEDTPLSLRDGHEVSMVWCVRDGDRDGPWLLLVNHSLRQIIRFQKAFEKLVEEKFFLSASRTPYFIALFVALCLFFVKWYIGLAALVAVLVWKGRIDRSSSTPLEETVARVIDGLGATGYAR